MLVSNDDVANGHANGTRVRLEKIVLEDTGAVTSMKFDGPECNVTEAANVLQVICTQEGNPDKVMEIEPKDMTCAVRAPLPRHLAGPTDATIRFKVSLRQLPFLANNATTGHKLQGQTKESLVMSVWSKRKNWNCVALSRVKTRAGLCLVQELPCSTDFSMSGELRAMLAKLKERRPDNVEFDLEEE